MIIAVSAITMKQTRNALSMTTATSLDLYSMAILSAVFQACLESDVSISALNGGNVSSKCVRRTALGLCL